MSIFYVFISVIAAFSLIFIAPVLGPKVQAQEPNPSTTPKITISKDGFNPKSLEIKQGESVTFTNQDEGDHWPASNIHPTHDVYPEFDTKQPLKPNQSWTFKFDRTGEWYYHDHLNPGNGGVVKVKGEVTSTTTAASSKSISIISKLRALYQSLKLSVLTKYYALLPNQKEAALNKLNINKAVTQGKNAELYSDIKLFGPEKIMAKLYQESGQETQFNCHNQAHQIGRIAYLVLGDTSITKNSSICHSGYTHGSLAAFVHNHGTENLVETMSTLCEKESSQYGKLTCYHSIGHGLLAYVNNDVPAAVNKCLEFNNDFRSENCLVGLFMENIGTATGDSLSPHSSNWINSSDSHFPCNQIDQAVIVQRTCYSMQAGWIFHLTKRDSQKTADECLKAPLPSAIGDCFFGLGQIISLRPTPEPNKFIVTCTEVTKNQDYQNKCIYGSLTTLMDLWDTNTKRQGASWCSLVPEPAKDGCLARVEERVTDLKFN